MNYLLPWIQDGWRPAVEIIILTVGIYRAFKKDLIHRLRLDTDDYFDTMEKIFRCGKRGISWEPFLSLLAHKYGYRVGEVPAAEPRRLGGQRKLRVLSWGGAFYTQFLLEFFRPLDPRMLPESSPASKNAGLGKERRSTA